MKLGSLFSGSGGFELAGAICGIEPVWASEVEPFPIRVTKKRFPHMKHLGDINKINGAEIEPVDIICGGSPCQGMSLAGQREGLNDHRSILFYQMIRVIKEMYEATNGEYPRYIVWENVCFSGDTLITCEDGYKNIKDISVGEKVKTLSGKYMPVMKLWRTKRQPVIKVSVSGGEDIICTKNHPFYVREKRYNTSTNNRIICEPKWESAENLTSKHLIAYRIDQPSLPDNFITDTEAWALGRYIADGSVDLSKHTPRIFISVGKSKIEEAREKLNGLPYDIHENSPHASVVNFVFSSAEFYALIAKVGIGAGNKQIPPFVFNLPISLQKVVLDGYISGDGYIRNRDNKIELTASTASRKLAYGICRLIRNVYHVSANISSREIKGGNINGRKIQPNYLCYVIYASLTNKCTQGFYENGIMWQPVKTVENIQRKEDVYNLSVMEDNTYAANDVCVHNCGAFSSNKGEDFRRVLEEFSRIKEPSASIPRPQKWEPAGYIRGQDWSLAYRTYDAQYWGVSVVSPDGDLVQRGTPQRRKRIYLVVDLAGERADRILFEPKGMSRYSESSQEQRKGAAVVAEDSIGRSGGIGVDKAVAFMGGQGSKAGSLGCSVDVYPTIRAAQSGSNSVPNVCYNPEWFSVNGYAEYVNKPPVLRASGGDAGGAQKL